MESEKEDVYSPTGVLEDYLRTLESEETVSSKASTSEFEDHKLSKSSSRWTGFFKLLKNKSKRHLGTLHPLNALKLSKRFSSSLREEIAPIPDTDLKRNFTLSELQTATHNFSRG